MIDDEWVFRFPRSDGSEAQYRKEQVFLPRLATRVQVSVPKVEHVGRLPDGRTFIGHRAIRGGLLTRRAVDGMGSSDLDAVSGQIAGFLKAMHAFPVDEARRLGAYDDRTRDGWAELIKQARGPSWCSTML